MVRLWPASFTRRVNPLLVLLRHACDPHTYTEDRLVEQPATGLFAELGWTTLI